LVDGNTNYAQAWLTKPGLDSARELPAARERERGKKAEARQRFWLSNLQRLVWLIIGSLVTLAALWLAKRLNLKP
jgi:hypothetical protein